MDKEKEYEEYAKYIWVEMAKVRANQELTNKEKAEQIRELSNKLRKKSKN